MVRRVLVLSAWVGGPMLGFWIGMRPDSAWAWVFAVVVPICWMAAMELCRGGQNMSGSDYDDTRGAGADGLGCSSWIVGFGILVLVVTAAVVLLFAGAAEQSVAEGESPYADVGYFRDDFTGQCFANVTHDDVAWWQIPGRAVTWVPCAPEVLEAVGDGSVHSVPMRSAQ